MKDKEDNKKNQEHNLLKFSGKWKGEMDNIESPFNMFNGLNIIQSYLVSDDEMWVSPQMFELIKNNIPEIKSD